jgi:hypothetical protein
MQLLGLQADWQPVLRKLGQMLFCVSPDQADVRYKETQKVCSNEAHFLNSYLCVNKSTKQQSRAMPSLATSRALQRMATTLMSGILFSAFQKSATPKAPIRKLVTYEVMLNASNEMKMQGNALHAVGYDIALRNWILEHSKDKLGLFQPKPKARPTAIKTPRLANPPAVKLQNTPPPIAMQNNTTRIATADQEVKGSAIIHNFDTSIMFLAQRHAHLRGQYHKLEIRVRDLERFAKDGVPIPEKDEDLPTGLDVNGQQIMYLRAYYSTGDEANAKDDHASEDEANAKDDHLYARVPAANAKPGAKSCPDEEEEDAPQPKPAANAKVDENYANVPEKDDENAPQQKPAANAKDDANSAIVLQNDFHDASSGDASASEGKEANDSSSDDGSASDSDEEVVGSKEENESSDGEQVPSEEKGNGEDGDDDDGEYEEDEEEDENPVAEV